MSDRTLSLDRLLADLPPEWPDDLLPRIREAADAGGRKLVVLDDDPTGTQTVYGVPVLTSWGVETLASELARPGPGFFVLTNSRSLPGDEARALAREIGANLRAAASRAGVWAEVVSRSDSTLRGHFPVEVDALAVALGAEDLPCLLIPFFLEGGRYTVHGVHYVADGDDLVPAARTPYASDAVFGYRHSDLPGWVEERTGGKVQAEQVLCLSVDEIRRGGPDGVARRLADLDGALYVAVDAVSYRDLEVVAAAVVDAEARGHRFLARTAASWVRTRMGLGGRPLLAGDHGVARAETGGLFVVGSYVPKTTAQLEVLLDGAGVAPVELRVDRLLDPAGRGPEVARATEAVEGFVRGGRDTVVYTSRGLVTGEGDRRNLEIGRRVSESLVAVVSGLSCIPRYLVAKGGITSSDVATQALGVRRAEVLGQLQPGVPVWRLGDETRYPGMAYVVFPGNVGDDGALARARESLSKNP